MLDRRTVLISVGTAALIASTAVAMPATDPDAELLALREPWDNRKAGLDDALDRKGEIDERVFARWLAFPAFETWSVDWTSYGDEHARIAALPARAVPGLAFKIEVSADWHHDREDISNSLMANVATFAVAHPALALPA